MAKGTDTDAGKRRIHWERLERATLLGIAWQGVLTFSVIASGLTSFPLFLGVFMLETVVVSVLTSLLYPSRGRRRLSDAAKMLFLMLFLCVFLVPMYMATQESRSLLQDPVEALGIGPVPVLVALLLMGMRVAWLWLQAARAPDRRLAWARHAAQGAAVNVITMFLAVFTCMVAIVLGALLDELGAGNAADIAFALVFVLTNAVLAAIMGTMSEDELKGIVANPYID